MNAEDFYFAKTAHQCLSDSDTVSKEIIVPGIGKFDLRVLLKEGLPKRISINRNGMYICDSMPHFGDKFRNFPMYKDFVAVVEPSNDEVGSWVRQLENPRHDELSPERLILEDDRNAAKKAGEKLAKLIRQEIRNEARNPVKDRTTIDELGAFFATENELTDDSDGIRNLESFDIVELPQSKRTTRPILPSTTKGAQQSGGGGARAGKKKTSSTKSNNGTGNGDGQTGSGSKAAVSRISLEDVRSIVPESSEPKCRRFWFTPKRSGTAVFDFRSAGLSESESLGLSSGKRGKPLEATVEASV